MSRKLLIYDAENNLMMNRSIKLSRIDICESHTIIYGELKGVQIRNNPKVDPFTIRLPWSFKSICMHKDVTLIYWLNDFYAIIDNA